CTRRVPMSNLVRMFLPAEHHIANLVLMEDIKTRVTASADLASATIDASLQAAVDGHIREQLTLAKWQLSKGLRLRGTAIGAMHLKIAGQIIDRLLGVG